MPSKSRSTRRTSRSREGCERRRRLGGPASVARPSDPAQRPAVIQRALELYRTAAHARRGGIVFLAGQPGSGRSVLLHAIEDALRHERPRPALAGGGFQDGHYVPWTRRKPLGGPVPK